MENKFEKFGRIEHCPIRNILDRFGDKWSILILIVLNEGGIIRFKELSRSIPDISQKMLTVTLRTLEADGLVTRTVYAEVPPRVEYALTVLGKSLIPYIESLTEWAVANFDTIESARKQYQT